MNLRFKPYFVLTIILFGASPTVQSLDSVRVYSGRVDSSHMKFFEDGSGKPHEFEFSTTDGFKFIMYSREVLLASRGALIDIKVSPIQSGERLIACAFEIKSIRVVSDGIERDLIYDKPLRFQTSLGQGCN